MDKGADSYRRFLDCEESAFDELIENYYEMLARFINGYVKDYAVAEDIAVDVYTYIIIHKHKYNFKTSFKTYLFMIGRSRALDYLKRSKKLKTVDFSDIENEISESAVPEDIVFADERREIVSNYLNKLPTDMREVLRLVYFEGLSYEETAAIMKKSRKQVDNLLYRSKEKLRSAMGKEGELLL